MSSDQVQEIQNIVLPEELEYFIQSLREFELNDIGSEYWLNCHEFIIKLTQQAILEANSYREESTKELLVHHRKLPILIHELFCVMIWKLKILPLLLEINSNPSTTFLFYSVLFHEGSIITILELSLFHQNGCESLGETAVDLVDYCAQAITQLIGLVNIGYHENISSSATVDEPTIKELERQKRDLTYNIGIKCLSVLNYLVDKIDSLSLSVGKRMVTVHDIPCLLSEILHIRPWLRKTKNGFEKFLNDKWVPVKGETLHKVTKTEAQTWFCFRQLLFNTKITKFYEINDLRRRELAKCQALITEILLDQLPPLAELNHFLYSLQLTSQEQKDSQKFRNLLLEEVPQIKSTIIHNAKKYGGYKKIAEEQVEIFLNEKHQDTMEKAKLLNQIYNFDFYAYFEDKNNGENDQMKKTEANHENDTKNICGNCEKEAEKKCSNCMKVYYCSRECQIANWSKHKEICI